MTRNEVNEIGTYYTLGIVKSFEATSYDALSKNEWKEFLNERFDIQQYSLHVEDKKVKGSLKKDVFEENIEDFYIKLVAMIEDDYILNWFNDHKTNMDKYDHWDSVLRFKHKGNGIILTSELAMLFIEGKVLAEEFYIEPKLINWLFRHANLSNKLAGCVMSGIAG